MSKIKIAIDCRMWGKTFGGIGRYIQEIVKYLLTNNSFSFTLIVAGKSVQEEIQKSVGYDSCDFFICHASMFSLKEQVFLPIKIPKCDIFWSPYMNVPFLPCRAKYRVVTLHDVFHLANPQYYSLFKRVFIQPFYYFSARKSDLILTVSRFSKGEIGKYCGVNAEKKALVIYNGCDIRIDSVQERQEGLKYILFVGSVKPHKNLKNALLGYKMIDNKELKFVIVGKKEGFVTGDKEVFEIVDNLNASGDHVVFTGNISDEELYSWYKGATALIQPSFYEGFGLPIVEAMKFGLPISCSDISVFREIGKDHVVYFDPYSPQSIARSLEKVVQMPRQIYPKWISWEDTAKQIAIEFEKLVNQ